MRVSAPLGLVTQKSKVPKWVCRSTLASFCNGQPFFAIFGPARGQIFLKNYEKIVENRLIFVFFGLWYRDSMQNGEPMGRQEKWPVCSHKAVGLPSAWCWFRRAFGVFFFQAEDGIRDRSPSRGLGDVYKRQTYFFGAKPWTNDKFSFRVRVFLSRVSTKRTPNH